MKKILVLFIAFFVQLNISFGQVINVSKHGIKPGKDVVLEVNELISSLKGKENVTLFFPKGKYEFYPENAFEEYRAVTNHDNSLKRIAFPIARHSGRRLLDGCRCGRRLLLGNGSRSRCRASDFDRWRRWRHLEPILH